MVKLKKVLPFLLVLMLFTGLGSYFFIRQESPKGVLILHGRVEGKEINISSKVQGRIVRLYKRESDPVMKGELLAELPSDESLAMIASAKKEVQAAEETVLMAKSYLIKSQAKLDQAKRDLERHRVLFQEGLVSKRDLELAELNYASALA